ncbi:hypothetical protein E3P99_01418 [Wallemia hederae]|uniref:Polyketide synthase-like phosphopantetheine-binding domain-containing protein n=1 Tax=Wallemia hederae TaxID=1540922 RepID=A0A4T0FQQ4_9BASI|nr:hypothetical protein E3P99_01418 [Wallemia hederae]
MVVVVPAFIEEWAKSKDSIDVLKKLDLVLYGGAGLSEVGAALSREGVPLLSVYGSTECGPSCCCFEKRDANNLDDWAYVVLSSNYNYRLIPQGDGLFEIHYLQSEMHAPSVTNMPGGYNTGDLVERHPTKANLIKVVGRSDSQIILASGEKTNPEPIERTIGASPLVSGCVMFGRQRIANGILIQPVDSVEDTSAFVDQLWPSIEAANEHAPQHSRLQRALVVVAASDKPLPMTPKGSIKRKAALELYDGEINEAYEKSDDDTTEQVPFDYSNVPASVAQVVKTVMGEGVEDDVDLVSQGLDSMQATMIRNKLVAALKPVKDVNLGGTVVFQYPKITLLASFIDDLLKGSGPEATAEDVVARKAAEINATIALHVRNLKQKPQHGWEAPVSEGKNVLVTGTTGGLGAQLLYTLIKDPAVEHVFALNRANARKGLRERQLESLIEKGMPADDILASPKLSLLEANLAKSDLGLDGDVYSDINAVDVIIHNAWRVDFNVALQSFEPDITGVVNLCNLAISSRHGAAIIFTSSIASVSRWPVGEATVEQPVSDASVAVGMGYGESKFVGERILAHASAESGLRTTVLRIGQLCGDREIGFWSSSNWVPAIIKSAQTLHCLPTGEDLVAWIALDDAARAVVDFSRNRRASGEKHDLLHLVHPRPTTWSRVFDVVADYLHKRGTEVELVEYKQWLEKLQKQDTANMTVNPAIKLLPMFESGHVSHERRQYVEAMGNPLLQTIRAEQASESLRKCTELSDRDVEKWMDSWVKEGFL